MSPSRVHIEFSPRTHESVRDRPSWCEQSQKVQTGKEDMTTRLPTQEDVDRLRATANAITDDPEAKAKLLAMADELQQFVATLGTQ